jgi:hypothetical protein
MFEHTVVASHKPRCPLRRNTQFYFYQLEFSSGVLIRPDAAESKPGQKIESEATHLEN